MAEITPTVPITQNSSVPPIIIHQDNAAFPTSIILDDTNYPLWSQLMEMRIGASNKAGYLTRETKKPPPEDPNFGTWITENHGVKSWLIDSMSPSLMQRFIRLSTANEIWEAVSRTFYDGSNEARLFELNRNLFLPHKMGESSSEENVLQEGNRGGELEFSQLEEMNEQFGNPEIENEASVPVSVLLEVRPESVSVPASVPLKVELESQVVPLEDRSESLMLKELPVIIPLTKESTQNVQNAFR
ncbi:hypothetical protein GH714_010150 [Hevea brasiliensis]|uniref:Retrotransposon Copia-like N-terminal domain-containing protein n=1 Tax=Hevea brasiliensis TaxID=3981 RepID=A0A6A6KEW3_HEVBR|nr:hypothetical protein GH714_010150 [Hevea brasiliensis]